MFSRKRLFFLTIAFSVSFVWAQLRNQVDVNGYSYETYLNDPAKVRIYTLKNGLKVYLAKNEDEPRIQTHIAVKTGSNNDPSDNTGLAHYLEHMLFKGTDKLGTQDWPKEQVFLAKITDLYEQHKAEKNPQKKREIYKQIDSVSFEASKVAIASEYDKAVGVIGANGTNAHTWVEETVYHNDIPTNELERWLRLESDRFSKLVLRLFHTEIEAVYEEYNRAQDNEYRRILEPLNAALFPTHPYGQQTTLGSPEHLRNPSLKAIQAYFDTYYVPNNIAIVLSGDIDFDKTIQLVDRYFGAHQAKPTPKKVFPKEKPLSEEVVQNVYSNSPESVTLAFRSGGVRSEDIDYLTLIHELLSGGAGLVNLELNQKQRVLDAGVYNQFFREYGMQILSARPKEGQSLEDVKGLLLSVLDKIKKGDFEDWRLEAAINKIKKEEISGFENRTTLARALYNSFIKEVSWQEVLNRTKRLSKITKQDLVNFANRFYGKGYVVVYKRLGENKNLVRLEKPPITPIKLNQDKESVYLKQFKAIVSGSIEPKFVDFKKAIKQENVKGIPFYFIQNPNNELFNFCVIVKKGSDHDKYLSLAANYLEYIGTNRYSPAELKNAFFKIGIDYSIDVDKDRTLIQFSGLKENFEKGLALVQHVLKNVKADHSAYKLFIDRLLKSRADSKTNKNSIFSALGSYAQYGKTSRFRDVLTNEQLKKESPEALVNRLKNLFDYQQEVFYYGNDLARVRKMFLKHHDFGAKKPSGTLKLYEEPPMQRKVYFANYDMVQTQLNLVARSIVFDPKLMAYTKLFNEYFGYGLSSIVFQEIRESKSLAYSAYSVYKNASEKGKYNYLLASIGTQSDKLQQALTAMLDLLNDMPMVEKNFNIAKESALKNIASERIYRDNIFWNYESLKKRGLDYDVRAEVYKKLKNMSLYDLKEFFNTYIKGQKYNVSIIGKKENIDFQALKKIGEVTELPVDALFGF